MVTAAGRPPSPAPLDDRLQDSSTGSLSVSPSPKRVKQELDEDKLDEPKHNLQKPRAGTRTLEPPAKDTDMVQGSIDMESLRMCIQDIQEHAAGLGAWAGEVVLSVPGKAGEDPCDLADKARSQNARIQRKLEALASGFKLQLPPMDLSEPARRSKSQLFELPVHDLTSAWVKDGKMHGHGMFADATQRAESPEPTDMTPIWEPVPALNRGIVDRGPMVPTLPPLTTRQQRAFNRAKVHEPLTMWVISSNDNGSSLRKLSMAIYDTWQLPPQARKCKVEDGNAAKMCPSLHLTGYYAGTDLIFASNFGSCPGCDTRGNLLKVLTISLPDGVILAQLNPDFGVDVYGNVLLQKETAIKKKDAIINPGQAVKVGLDKLLDRNFLGKTFSEVKRLGGTYMGPGAAPGSAAHLTRFGCQIKANKHLMTTAPAKTVRKRGPRETSNDTKPVKRVKKNQKATSPDPVLEQDAASLSRRTPGVPGIKSEDADVRVSGVPDLEAFNFDYVSASEAFNSSADPTTSFSSTGRAPAAGHGSLANPPANHHSTGGINQADQDDDDDEGGDDGHEDHALEG
ncbi:hypothetical protein NX059_001946 [Plenodomus lindquistii]|nr:hypothetical protein NX059_001946 [Plenodomus lindquistii]